LRREEIKLKAMSSFIPFLVGVIRHYPYNNGEVIFLLHEKGEQIILTAGTGFRELAMIEQILLSCL